MSWEIPYLGKLEKDLTRAAAAAAETRGGARRRRPGQGAWLRWSGAAAAILVLAWVVGTVLPGGGLMPASGDANMAVAPAATAPTAPAEEGRERASFEADDQAVAGAQVGLDAADRTTWSTSSGQAGLDEQNDGGGEAPVGPGQTNIDLAKIDRDGSVTLKIPEGTLGEKFLDVIDIAERSGGMLLSSETVGSTAARLTLRIPAGRFDRALAEVSQLGEVRASSVTAEDVTAEFIDYKARLDILQRRKAVILSLYDQVTTISQTLQLEGRLNEVQLEIDRIRGQLNYLEAQTSISTLKVSMSETEPEVEALSDDDGSPSLGEAFGSASDGFLGVVSAMIVGLGYLLPVAFVLAIVFGVVMLVRRRDHGAS
jgi:hypothetical protein